MVSGFLTSPCDQERIWSAEAREIFTESKSVTQHWFDEEEKKAKEVDTWDGLL